MFGLAPLAGERIRVRILALADEFYLCSDNFTAEPAIGDYVTSQANDTTFTAGNGGAIVLKVLDTKTLITGQVNNGTMYRCRVEKLS